MTEPGSRTHHLHVPFPYEMTAFSLLPKEDLNRFPDAIDGFREPETDDHVEPTHADCVAGKITDRPQE